MNAPLSCSEWHLAHGKTLTLGPKSVLMGIVNVTPDSFSDGGDLESVDAAVAHAREMVREGALIVDIGGESTRPGGRSIDAKEEQDRILPVLEALREHSGTLLSVDTYRAETAARAVDAGAHVVNDVWGCQREPDIADVAADSGAGLVIMNTRREREVLPDLLDDALAFLERSLGIASRAGVTDEQIAIDPGFGFSPSAGDDIPILNGLERLQTLGFPILVGTSRKRFLGKITGREEPKDRAVATAATSVIARLKGAAVFRVHDVEENADALAVADAVLREGVSHG